MIPEKHSKIRSNSELAIWFILPGLVLNLCLGFLFTLLVKEAFLEIKSVEEGDTYFQALRIIFLCMFITGLFVENLIPITQSKFFKAVLTFAVVLEIAWNYRFASNEFMIDYIFHRNYFVIFFSMNCFLTGYIISSFKNFRIWSFLAGSIAFILYSIVYTTNGINSKDYLFPFLFVLIVKFGTILFFHDYGIFFEKKKPNDRDSYSAFFYSGIILFTSHLVLTFFTPSENTELFLSGITFGALFFSILSYYGLFYEKVKLKFLIAEFFLIGNIILTANQSGFGEYSFFLFLSDMALLTFFRPSKISKRFVFISTLIGISITISLIFFLPSASSYRIRDIAVIIFTILFLFPLYSNKLIGLYHRIFVLFVSAMLAFFFHSPFDFSKNIPHLREDERLLIPFALSEINFDDQKFIYYSSDLPFDNRRKLPDKNKLQNKTLVLGARNISNVMVSYIAELIREKADFFVIRESLVEEERFKKFGLQIVEFPFFYIYYPPYSLWNFQESSFSFGQIGTPWTKNYVFPKLKNLKTPQEILPILDTIEKYSGKDLRDYSEKIRNRFFESYMTYCKYYFAKKNYSQTIKTAVFAFKFGKPDQDALRMVYESATQVSPEEEYIPVLKYLAEIPAYRENILKRLIPILVASENTEEALQKIDDLISLQKTAGREDDLQALYIEKAKIFLGQKDILKAGEIIQKELRQNPNSVAWNKLNEELNLQREEIRQRWMTDKSKQLNITIE